MNNILILNNSDKEDCISEGAIDFIYSNNYKIKILNLNELCIERDFNSLIQSISECDLLIFLNLNMQGYVSSKVKYIFESLEYFMKYMSFGGKLSFVISIDNDVFLGNNNDEIEKYLTLLGIKVLNNVNVEFDSNSKYISKDIIELIFYYIKMNYGYSSLILEFLFEYNRKKYQNKAYLNSCEHKFWNKKYIKECKSYQEFVVRKKDEVMYE